MGYLVLAAFTVGKFGAYAGLFGLLGRTLGAERGTQALRAAWHRFWMGLAATALVIPAAVALSAAGGARVGPFMATGLVWALRALAWWLAARWTYPDAKERPRALAALVTAGLVLNLVVDVLLWKLLLGAGGGGRGGLPVPTLGNWEIST